MHPYTFQTLTNGHTMIPYTPTMIIPVTDYNIIRNDVPVLTRTDDGAYISTNCLLNDFNIESKNLENILSGFDYKNNILDAIKQYGHSPKYTPVLHMLTNSNIQTPDFDISQDILAIALFLAQNKNTPIWLHFFEVNRNYRQYTTVNQTYKRTGESALKSLQQEYIHQGIEGRSTYSALSFYLKYGFKRIDDRECYLHWGPQR